MDDLPSSYVEGIRISVLRLDQLDPAISGNKAYKLRFYLEEATSTGRHVVTFGGAWSNHIVATAVACQQLGIACTGLIRGEEPASPSVTLIRARNAGMELVFLPRSDYREKKMPVRFHDPLYLVIPEGGYGIEGARGAATIFDHTDVSAFSHCFCAVGTGATIAGLINSPRRPGFITGVPVLKNAAASADIAALLQSAAAGWQLVNGYEFGGYAKYNASLITFMNDFYRLTTIPTDFVYTAKLFYAVTDLLRNGYAAAGSSVLVIHSGGLQGNAGLPNKTLIF